MRLIDADALRLMKVEECAGHSIEYAMGWKACLEYINAAPAIDAIPMWWITEKFLDVLNKDKELSKAVWLVRKAWQKEQEAKQCEIHD